MTSGVSTHTVAEDMMQKGLYFSARDLVSIYGVSTPRAHSIMTSLSSGPQYEVERLACKPMQLKILSVDGVRLSGPRWFQVLLYSKWPLKQQVAS